ncbi:hypothetical protein [Nocardia sp. BMG51109]|uniref:hypothetical protein n=1 Tax=Nocardia sp. BMG51109 TaxID=1056816 RepID=UPI0004AD0C24|nr:hypothetical protein [Nocardia sp. BMG51109]
MAQPFPPGPPPNNPAQPPGQGWGPPAGVPGQPMPGYPPPGGGRGAAGPVAAAGLILAALLYVVRRIWSYIDYDRFFWSDLGVIVTVLVALAGGVLLFASGKSAARLAAGIAAGMVLAPHISYLFGSFDRSSLRGYNPWSDGGWLTIPVTLLALGVIAALLAAEVSGGTPQSPNSWPRQPAVPPQNVWPQPPMGGVQQSPPGYPGQQPPPQWPQQ